jgi:hypothetical protein
MPNVYHSEDVFKKFVAEYGGMDEAREAIKKAVRDEADGLDQGAN